MSISLLAITVIIIQLTPPSGIMRGTGWRFTVFLQTSLIVQDFSDHNRTGIAFAFDVMIAVIVSLVLCAFHRLCDGWSAFLKGWKSTPAWVEWLRSLADCLSFINLVDLVVFSWFVLEWKWLNFGQKRCPGTKFDLFGQFCKIWTNFYSKVRSHCNYSFKE